MSPEAVTTERVYALLKADIVRGRYPPRTEIVIASIARDHGVSIQPIRDSAQRLVGERLLEPLHGGGFAIPDITEQGLRDLYAWHGQLMRFALQPGKQLLPDSGDLDVTLDEGSGESLAAAATSIFQRIACRSGNRELCRAVEAAGERLHAVRIKEFRHIPNIRQELTSIQRLALRQEQVSLMRAIRAYERRRLKRADLLVEAIGGTLEEAGRSF
ncbi:MAG: GntR family transcriptional regulator [Sphingomonas sp.]|nr:GntR family transcriptional regulator [Sphingomonas sp.]